LLRRADIDIYNIRILAFECDFTLFALKVLSKFSYPRVAMKIKSVVIIGSGNVATHLGRAIKNAGCSIDIVFSRNQKDASNLAAVLGAIPYTNLLLMPTHADLYLIAVKDSAIEEVSNLLPEVKGLVVHTSGSTSIDVLHKHKHAGVFYPLQSLSKNTEVTVRDIPVLLETIVPEDLQLLVELAERGGVKVVEVNSENRRVVHLAAVFANNFSNYLYTVAEQILSTKGLSIDILKPLIAETAHKVQGNKPSEVQTGPAVRNDVPTMEMHLRLMEQMPQFKQIYELLSKGIGDNPT
jgi:predicted short-subunit dehydrogenase-like oxidoreductase (DUF2520 family)